MSERQSPENDEVGECLWANQICEQPNHHGCRTCLAVEPDRPIPPRQSAENDTSCRPRTGWLSGETYCAVHGRAAGWPCVIPPGETQ